jgi:hypothetical protein
MSSADNKKLVQQVYADSANRSGTTFLDNLAEDVTWIVTGQYSWSHEFQGRDAINNGLMGHLRSLLAGAAAHGGVQLSSRKATTSWSKPAATMSPSQANATTINTAWSGASRTARSRRSRNIAIPHWSSACSGHSRQSEGAAAAQVERVFTRTAILLEGEDRFA